jgi:Interferon-induced transmembrane protein/WW domain
MQSSSEATSERPHFVPMATALGNTASSPFATVPGGWTIQVDPQDGRIYYLETVSGRRSWIHPHADTTMTHSHDPITSNTDKWRMDRNPLDTPLNATRRPDAHQCQSVVACLMCPALGILALYHSLATNRAWNQERYSDAMGHSREAPKYAQLATCLGMVFWIWFFFFRPQGQGREWWGGIWDNIGDWGGG